MENREILKKIDYLPQDLKRQIYDFIEFLTGKWKRQKDRMLPSFIDKPIEVHKIVKLGREEAHARQGLSGY